MDTYNLSGVLSHLPADFPWRSRIRFLEEVDSTNNLAKEMAVQNAPAGTVVLAARQSAGRGRMGRQFSSPAGMGVYCSVLLRPRCAPSELMHLTCASAVAARRAVIRSSGVNPSIKWINDLVAGKRKLSGTLTEMSISPESGLVSYAVIGIGINCCQTLSDFPEELQDKACSLRMLTGYSPDLNVVAAGLILELQALDAGLLTQKEETMAEYRESCMTLGKEISVVSGQEVCHAFAEDIDRDGGLIIRLPDGTRRTVNAGEVSVRGMYGYL